MHNANAAFLILSYYILILIKIILRLRTCPHFRGPKTHLLPTVCLRNYTEQLPSVCFSNLSYGLLAKIGDDGGTNLPAVTGRLFCFTIRPRRLSRPSVAYEFTSIPGRVQFYLGVIVRKPPMFGFCPLSTPMFGNSHLHPNV